jgi:hypothetical protein
MNIGHISLYTWHNFKIFRPMLADLNWKIETAKETRKLFNLFLKIYLAAQCVTQMQYWVTWFPYNAIALTWGSHGVNMATMLFLGCDAMWTRTLILKFRKKILSPSSVLKMGAVCSSEIMVCSCEFTINHNPIKTTLSVPQLFTYRV